MLELTERSPFNTAARVVILGIIVLETKLQADRKEGQGVSGKVELKIEGTDGQASEWPVRISVGDVPYCFKDRGWALDPETRQGGGHAESRRNNWLTEGVLGHDLRDETVSEMCMRFAENKKEKRKDYQCPGIEITQGLESRGRDGPY